MKIVCMTGWQHNDKIEVEEASVKYVLSLQYLAGVAVKKILLSISYPHSQNVVCSRPKYF